MKKIHKVLLLLIGLLAFFLLTSCEKKADCYTTADISYRDGVSIEAVAELTEILASMPELSNEFFTNGGRIYISNADLQEELELEGDYHTVAGCHCLESKRIFIHEDYVEKFTHEFGHYVYHRYSVIDDAEFNEVYEAEVEKLIEVTGRDYFKPKGEFFAESFYYYIEEKETLEKELPETYEYINRVVEVYNS